VGRRPRALSLVAVLAATLGTGCASSSSRAPRTADDRPGAAAVGVTTAATGADEPVQFHDIRGAQVGLATWYGGRLAGHRTASGERFDPKAMTAAHLTLPLGTWVEVRRTDGQGPAVRVRINDRGPYGDSRKIIDLSRHAADVLGIVRKGTAEVSIRLVAGP
jgi:rare lipoprotein A